MTVTWNDGNNMDGNRPSSVTIRLYADGVEVDSHVLTATNNWKFTFVEKPRYQGDIKPEIVYTVGEDAVAMYVATVLGNNIVNDYQPEFTSLSVVKIWDDYENEKGCRPDSIAMKLYNGQQIVNTVMLSKSNYWAATVNNLPTVLNGETVQYTWEEQTVLSYELSEVRREGNFTYFTNRILVWPHDPTPDDPPPL